MFMNNYAFIDSQNLNLGVLSQGWKLDFAKFRVYLEDKYQITKAFLFIGDVKGNESLYKYLKRAGYVVILKPTREHRINKKRVTKGNVDAELVLHCMIEYSNYDKATIVSGDGDFYCLAEYLESKKKLDKIIVPNRKYSSLLRKYAGHIVNVGLMKEKFRK